MIICGYPCIGKSHVASSKYGIIDLESSLFRPIGDNWYLQYTSVAYHLSQQGFVVLISAHKQVRDRLEEQKVPYYVAYPSIFLKDKWIQRAEERYLNDPDGKNQRAYDRIHDHFEEDIQDLKDCAGEKIVIQDHIDDLMYHLHKIKYFR